MSKRISEEGRVHNFFLSAPIDAAVSTLNICKSVVAKRLEAEKSSAAAPAPRTRRKVAKRQSKAAAASAAEPDELGNA